MSEDKELLELAAKAIGLEYFTWCGDGLREQKVHAVPHCGHQGMAWNPISDDTDALRLAVFLNIAIEPRDDTGEVFATFMGSTGAKLEFFETREPFGNDKYAATRRAIVKAAAAIGRRMSNGT